MESFLVAAGLVAVAEIGDKTQLLTFVLASRFGRPVPIILGILVATLANHGLAAGFGVAVAAWLGGEALRWGLGLGFLAMAAWALVPDKEPEDGVAVAGGLSVFAATVIAFFIAEMGDKTQVATVGLAAQQAAWAAVTLGTTAGMLLANVPVAVCGRAVAARVPLRAVRLVAALAFAVLGAVALLGLGATNLAPGAI